MLAQHACTCGRSHRSSHNNRTTILSKVCAATARGEKEEACSQKLRSPPPPPPLRPPHTNTHTHTLKHVSPYSAGIVTAVLAHPPDMAVIVRKANKKGCRMQNKDATRWQGLQPAEARCSYSQGNPPGSQSASVSKLNHKFHTTQSARVSVRC